MSKLISKIVVPDSSEATGYALYNVKDANAIPASEKGVASGVATLDSSGKVPSSQLPAHQQGEVNSIKIGTTEYDPEDGVITLPEYPTTLPASDVSAWAKASSKPTYTKSEVGLSNVTNDALVKRSEMGAANGVATLDSAGKVPASQLPSYVDDVLEYDTKSAFPATGEGGKIYVDKSTNTSWRWSGSTYTQIKGDIVIGTTSGTAADGGIANTHYNNTSNPHSVTKAQVGLGSVVNTGDSATPVSGGTTKFTTGGAYTELNKKVDKTTTVNGHALSGNVSVTKSDVGLGNVGNFKAVSTVASQGLSDTEKSNARANIGAGTSSFSGSYNDLSNKPTIPTNNNQLTNGAGYITGITKSMVTTALGYTPPTSDTNTWRGIQNNLTSTSTSDSLSANQGRLLANGSARDSTKLPLTGGTVSGNVCIGNITSACKLAVDGSIDLSDDIYLSNNSRIRQPEKDNNFLYIGTTGNYGWVRFQDICSQDGNAGDSSGWSIRSSGAAKFVSVTQTSDIRKKDIIENINLDIKDIACAPIFKFTWIDPEMPEGINVGTSAQYWQTILPNVVSEMDDKRTLSMQYGVAGLVSSIALAKKVVEQEETIKAQETRIKALEDAIVEIQNKLNN